ncbi:MAG: FKBP-type peptidyl-prolyl cis-trans isomerase [Bacteroidota bacterium]
MIIDKNKIVTVNYILTARKGLSLEEKQIDESRSFVFLSGAEQVLPEFEKNLFGKKADDKFDFFISAENGYGMRDEKYVMNISIDAFKNSDGTFDLNKVCIGNMLTMADNQGNRSAGKILEITSTYVRMDFNHPLADHELHFVGKVLDVRLATAEEISHKHVHDMKDHHHC